MRKRICVMMIGLHSDYASFIVQGMSDQAKQLGYDIYVYSYFGFRSANGKRLFGETNILSLVHPEDYDGFIVYKGLISEEEIRSRIEAICQASGKPYFDIEDPDTPDTAYPMSEDREKFRLLTEHLLTAHGCRKIYCITGYEGFHQSESRLAGYRDAMRAHGVEPPVEWEFYGDFWKDYARDFADRLASGEIPMPDAIACAVTSAAITLIERLREHGIYVPEDLAVVGYDFALEGEMCESPITSISFPHYNNGVKAVCRLHKLMTGEACMPIPYQPEALRIGASCGCRLQQMGSMTYFRDIQLEKVEYRELFRNSGMQEQITKTENTTEFFHQLSSCHYIIRGIRTMHYFLCDDWDGIRNVRDDDYRKSGYSDLLHVYSQTGLEPCQYCTLPLPKVQDYVAERQSEPSTFFFFPLHYEDRVFGFIGMQFRETRFTPDEQFWHYLEILNNSLETIRIRQYITRFSERIRLAVIRDPLTGIYNCRGFEELSAEIFEHAVIRQEYFLLILIRIGNLTEIQQELGYAQVDQLLIQTAAILSKGCKGNEVCCHTQQETFYIVGSHHMSHSGQRSYAQKITEYFVKHFQELDAQYGAQLDMEVCYALPEEATALSQIIQQLEQDLNKRTQNRYRKVQHTSNLEDMRKLIHAHPEKKWTIDMLAKRMMLSRAYFQRMYKQKFGISVSADIIAARIEKGKQLLLSGCSIYDTAERCGYSSDVYFMHQFKKETGMTPTEFINESKNAPKTNP